MPRFRRKSSEADIAQVVGEFELPTFPQVATEALQRLADPDVDLRSVAGILERDPGLSVHLLRIANSASLGLRNTVDSLDRAVAMLGRNQVESILIGQAVSSSLAATAPPIEASRFGAAAATRAVVASQIALRVDPARRSEHFTAGLLQDMAILVLAEQVPGYDDILLGWYEGTVPELVIAEQDRFGWDHAEIAAGMCREWSFPERLADAIGSHHDDADVLSPSQLVAEWHEVDADRGPAAFAVRAIGVDELAPHLDAILEAVDEQVAEVTAIFH